MQEEIIPPEAEVTDQGRSSSGVFDEFYSVAYSFAYDLPSAGRDIFIAMDKSSGEEEFQFCGVVQQ